ncbi:hypothetical protein MTP09_06040 [Chryseobacterium suipulveris]|uniref:Uncharacterized protein n=1 Tax=Chryseobacterium suipulveris TaxID=2929800 RepID=A0ABY4BST5_9FLAO|nr:hypothetical protein [Chryseobacterium suipulveris]UOE42195.1 hypothetical protein MTP09_06040 [Chryseobacterium suipulveris]
MKFLPFDFFIISSEMSKNKIIDSLKDRFKSTYDYELKINEKNGSILLKRMKVYGMKSQNSYLNVYIKIKEVDNENCRISFFSYLRLMHWILYLTFVGFFIFILFYSEHPKKYYVLPWVIFLYLFGINNDGLNTIKNTFKEIFS